MNKRFRSYLKACAFGVIYSKAFQKFLDFVLRNNLHPTLINLRQLGFKPDLILDVGAYIGEWSSEVLPLFPEARGIMFEAQSGKIPVLETVCQKFSGRLSMQTVLLGKECGFKDFYRLETGSSIYRENTSLVPVVEKLEMKTLDDVLGGSEILPAKRILLKLDVQGAEKDILLGATRLLKNVEVIVMELSLLEYNHGAPLAHEVIAFVAELGFVPFGISGIHRMKGQVVQIDMAFVQKTSPLRVAATKAFQAM